MTAPQPAYTGPGTAPNLLFLRAEEQALKDIIRDLQDAAAEAQRRINKLETKYGIGTTVERAQLALVKRELHGVQRELWLLVNRRMRAASSAIAEAALLAEIQLEQVLFRAIGSGVPDELIQAQREYARQTVQTYLARGENGIGLSERVYRTRQLANGLVDRAINREILLGNSWQGLARAVRPYINPDTPGGVSYAAKRLARTELNNAFHRTQIGLAAENPWVEGQKWNISRSHKKPDRCDELARGHSRGKAEGVYAMGEVPSKPHPQCLCYLTSVTMDEDEFIETLARLTPGDVARMYGNSARSA